MIRCFNGPHEWTSIQRLVRIPGVLLESLTPNHRCVTFYDQLILQHNESLGAAG